MQVRLIKVEGDIAYVPLTKGYEAIISVEDVPMVEEVNWSYGSGGYAMRNAHINSKTITTLMHRLILQTPQGLLTDHINGDKLDNRRTNLRICDYSTNMMNTSKKMTNKSGYKGVSWDKVQGKWQVQMMVKRKKLHLGRFVDLGEAIKSYALASDLHHKEYKRVE